MGFLSNLFKNMFTPPPDAFWVYLQCQKCGEKIKVRINTLSEVSQADNGTYFVQKEAMGSKCFNRIPFRLELDRFRNIKNKEITGGKFITEKEFNSTDTNQ
jgi:hypothetical protein